MFPTRVSLPLIFMAVVSSVSLLAQSDLAGNWSPIFRNQDGSGLDGDYAGLPLSEAGRWRAQSFVPDMVDVPEFVCRPHSWAYSIETDAAQLRFSTIVDSLSAQPIAYHGRFSMREQEASIWMDGRPHPPALALFSWSGFSTGEW